MPRTYDSAAVMRWLAFVGLLGAAFLGASAAGAKVPPQITVCGRSLELQTQRTCLQLDYRQETAQQLVESRWETLIIRSRPRPAPYYTVRVHFPDDPRWDWWLLYAPSRHLVRESTPNGVSQPVGRSVYWRTAPAKVTQAFKTLGQGLRPIPAPRHWR